MECTTTPHTHTPWKKCKLVGQKAPLKPQEVWATRVRLQMESRPRELALFDLSIDSKLRACDLVKLRVCHGDRATQGRLLAVSSFGSHCSVADRFVAPYIGPGSAICGQIDRLSWPTATQQNGRSTCEPD